jgi:hypothetical protein
LEIGNFAPLRLHLPAISRLHARLIKVIATRLIPREARSTWRCAFRVRIALPPDQIRDASCWVNSKTTSPIRNDLNNATPQSRPRVSKLAAGLPILAFAACPCVVSIALSRVEEMGVIIHHAWAYKLFLPFVFPITIVALGMLALFRIARSDGRLLGAASAKFSIGLCAFWIFVWAMFIFVLEPLALPSPG